MPQRRQSSRGTRGRRHRREGGDDPGPGSVAARVEAAIASAAGSGTPSPDLVDALARQPPPPAGSPPSDPVDRALAGVLVDAVADAWRRGWQPVDLHRAVARARGRPASQLVARAVAVEAGRHAPHAVPPRWRQQLDALGVDPSAAASGGGEAWAVPWPGPPDASTAPGVARVGAVAVAVATVATVRGLPPLPRLGPVPGEASADLWEGHGDDAGVLRKARSLLAKAESTTFPEEAEALTAKAQQLMTRHAVDAAQLGARRRGEPAAVGRRLPVDDPYANARYLLLASVANANRCRAVLTRQWGFATVFGVDGDLDAVELLFTSLLVQATRAMDLEPAGAAGGGSRTRSFRHAFLVAFAARIGERLADASDMAAGAAARRGTAVVPLLAARRQAADRALGEAFPQTRAMRVSARNADGWQAGVRAADRAQLGAERRVRGPGPRALG
jgi:hypothetical protein